MKEKISIAIDGPSGAGKSTLARSVAEKLGISRSYVSRIEKRALEKLRKGMESAGGGR